MKEMFSKSLHSFIHSFDLFKCLNVWHILLIRLESQTVNTFSDLFITKTYLNNN